MRKRWLDTIYRLAAKDPRIVFIGSDLTNDAKMAQFRQEMPDRFYMDGISEAHLVGMAAGLAMSGKIAYFNTIATFITRRSFEQNVIDLGLTNTNVRLIGNGGGLVYAPLGPTHLAIEDIAIMCAIPNMTVVAPVDADEMERAIEASVDHKGPIYFRVAKGGDPIISKPEQGFSIGRAVTYREPGDVLLVSTGIMTSSALQAAATLVERGVKTGVIHVHTIKPLDKSRLLAAMAASKAVVTIEEHVLHGGLGSAVAELIAEHMQLRHVRFKRLGLPDLFPDQYGSQSSLLAKYGLSAENIEVAALKLLSRD